MKARAVDEMMERIRKGIVLKPTQKAPQVNRFRATVLCSFSDLNEGKFMFNIYIFSLQTDLDEDSWKVSVY